MIEKKNYPGMFDLIKGYGIITIVVSHTAGRYSWHKFVHVDLQRFWFACGGDYRGAAGFLAA